VRITITLPDNEPRPTARKQPRHARSELEHVGAIIARAVTELRRGDSGRDPLAEVWFRFDPLPPRPSVLSAVRAVYAEGLLVSVIEAYAKIGRLDVLREDLRGSAERYARAQSGTFSPMGVH